MLNHSLHPAFGPLCAWWHIVLLVQFCQCSGTQAKKVSIFAVQLRLFLRNGPLVPTIAGCTAWECSCFTTAWCLWMNWKHWSCSYLQCPCQMYWEYLVARSQLGAPKDRLCFVHCTLLDTVPPDEADEIILSLLAILRVI